MKRTRRATTWALVGMMACSTLTAGCDAVGWFGSNYSLNFVVPLGLGGTPGILNPFGIVQAWVNSLIGSTTDETDDTTAYEAPSGSSSPSGGLDPGTINVITS